MTKVESVYNKQKSVSCLGFELNGFTKEIQFVILTCFVLLFHLIYGYLQELIFTTEGLKERTWSVTMLQFGFYSLFAKTERVYRNDKREAPISMYLFLAGVTISSMGFSNASLEYVNFPTQVIFKCCKLIPVLIGGIIIQKKTYGPLNFISAILMSVGLSIFLLVDSKVSPNFEIEGIVMLSISIAGDSILGNYQETIMTSYHALASEVTYYSYLFGFIYLLLGTSLFGVLLDSIHFFNGGGTYIYGIIFAYSISGYLGVQVILSMIKTFGALTTVTVTNFRKGITIVLSFLLFEKPFSIGYVYSSLIILAGIYLNLATKYDCQNVFKFSWFKTDKIFSQVEEV